jgi:hypothetical protein
MTNETRKERRPWISVNVTLPTFKPPATTTVLAIGFLVGLLLFTPMVALIGDRVPSDYREDVREIVKLIRDGMLLILGFYFAKVVNTGQEDLTNRAFKVAQESRPKATEECVDE